MCEEKRLTEWKQGHTPERSFGAPAFGGGFFLPRVIHRPSGVTNSFKLQNASKALLLVLQGIKKPAVKRTSGQVMGELTIWPSSWLLPSPTFSVLKAGTEHHRTMSGIWIC